jgi:hypothetical protein
MPCPEHDRRLQHLEDCRNALNYFLFHDELHLLSAVNSRKLANRAASALAKASNKLHCHDARCAVCRKGKIPIARG